MSTSSSSSSSSSSNIIIRLQNLPNEARAIDIRRFFAGLNIPDGGVHVVGGEKGDAFINFNSDDDARQAMMKSGNIYGNQIKLFLSSRAEMQSVIAQARANPPTKHLPTIAVGEQQQQQQQEDNNTSKMPIPNTVSTILAEFQAKAAQQQQLQMQQQQQTAPVLDPMNSLLLSAIQNGVNPLAVQQLLSTIAEKQQFPFQLPTLTNPMNQFTQPNNGWMNQQFPNAFPARPSANLAFPQANNPFLNLNPDANVITADEPYIRVRNIPVAYSYYNIKLLFSKYKLNLSDIKIINDQNGQRTGEIVLRLHTNQDVADLLSQDGRIQCFNSMLDIKKIDEYTFASVVDSFLPAHAKKNSTSTIKNCVRVTGLPKSFERKDVKRFFNGCNVTNRPGGIFIETDTYNGPIFVEFETEIDAEKAFFYNGEQNGSTAIEMYRMTKSDMENEINSLKRGTDRPARRPPLLQHHEPLPSNNRPDNSPHLLPNPSSSSYHRHSNSPLNTHSYSASTNNFNQDQPTVCLRLRNIPYSTTEQQIYDFFSSGSIQIDNCKILLDRLNRGAGEAVVKFADTKSCQLAYDTKNRQIFYGRTLDLRPLSLSDYQSTSITPMLTANDLASPATLNQHFQQQHNNNKRYSNFYDRDNNDRRNEKRPRWDGSNNNNNNNHHQNRNAPRMSKNEQTNERSSSSPTNLPPLPSELNEYIGRILFLSNVPYRATREEILDFLRAYSPIPETLKIRCDVSGKPTGFGVVACETKSDASRAVSELDNQMFMNRNIHLQQR